MGDRLRLSSWGSLAICLLLVSLGTLSGQSRNAGEIRGTVTDSSGARVPGVRIVIQNTETGVVTNIVAGETGIYDAPSLEPGTYSVLFAKDGFKQYVAKGIVLHVETITVDGMLQLGEVNQQVVVTSEVQLLQTETSDKRTTLTPEVITEMPNVGRGWYETTGLLPGVNPGNRGSGSASNQDVGVNGMGSEQENWQVDGGIGMLPVGQNPDLLQTPLEAIAEVNFNTANMSAEYGSGVAVFNVITKSGTNRFHGSAFEYLQNSAMQARDFFNPDVPVHRWNQFGGTIGGPIKKDKAFFFFSYQRNPVSGFDAGWSTFPSEAYRNGNFSGLPAVFDPATLAQQSDGTWIRAPFAGNQVPATRFDAVSAKIQEYYPKPQSSALTNNYYYTTSSPNTTIFYNGKADYNISSGNRLTASMMYVTNPAPAVGPTCPIGCQNSEIDETTGQISDVWTISPNIVNEFRTSVVREYGIWNPTDFNKGYASKLGMKNLPVDAFPDIDIGGIGAPGELGSSWHALLGFTQFVASDSMTLIKGKHILKFGGEYNRMWDNNAWADTEPGYFNFSGLFTQDPRNPDNTGIGYADFLLGVPNNWNLTYGPGSKLSNWNMQAFVQDDIKLTPKLTINLGLRYLLQTGWVEEHRLAGSFDPKLTNPATGTLGSIWIAGQNGRTALENTKPWVFAPRVGFAWSPKTNWSVRGAWGIFDLQWGGNGYTSYLGLAGSSGNLSATDGLHTLFQMQNGAPLAATPGYPPKADSWNGQGIVYTPADTAVPMVQQWNLGVQHKIAGGIVLDLAYVGSHGSGLRFRRDANQVPASVAAQYGGTGADMQTYRPYPQYQGIMANYTDGWSNYHSLQFSLKKNLGSGLSLLTNYTYGSSHDTGTTAGWTGGGLDQEGSSGWQNAYNPGANYGRSAVDIRHLWNGSVVYQLPFGKGKRFLDKGGVLNSIAGGWQLSTTFQVHSGIPFTPLWGGPDLSYTLGGDWRPNRTCSGNLSNASIALWFDPSCFSQAKPGTFGNSGRNILDGPGYKNVNLSMAKNWKLPFIGERGSLQLRGDATNVLNHPNFGQPNVAVTSTDPAQTSAGQIWSTHGSRNLQVGAKVSF